MDRSLFSKASSSMHGFLSDSNHELPRWRSPSPMAASVIPPPIVGSSPPRPVTQSTIVERPSPLQDRQSELEADLQFLLNAQAEGLVRGLEGGVADDQASTGSTTPTAQSMRSSSARKAARPVRRKLGLRSARKGIYNAMLALSAVKDDELQGIGEDVHAKEQALEKIDEWEMKRKRLREASKNAESDEERVREQRLRQEADTLQEEINHVELQLNDMKARHRKIMKQVAGVENSVQAKLASYSSSLRMLEEDVQKFLSINPPESSSPPMSRDGQTSIWQLPAKRRTLDMARQQWTDERDAVMLRRDSVQYEKTALDEGTAIWKDVVTQVTEFERQLRGEMAQQSGVAESTSGVDASNRLGELLSQMDRLIETLGSKLELVQERNWNLLIAAIGAELDALEQGKQLLQNVIRPGGETEEVVSKPQNGDLVSDGGDKIHDLDQSFMTARRRVSRSTESEDDPDPELLFSTQDIDKE